MLAWRDVDIPLNPQEGHRGYQIVRPVGKAGNNPQDTRKNRVYAAPQLQETGEGSKD